MSQTSIPDKIYLPYSLEATASTVEDSATPTRRILNGYIVNDGAVDITFKVRPAPDIADVTFTLKPNEINDTPFTFTRIKYSTASSTAAFRVFGTQY